MHCMVIMISYIPLYRKVEQGPGISLPIYLLPPGILNIRNYLSIELSPQGIPFPAPYVGAAQQELMCMNYS